LLPNEIKIDFYYVSA